MSNAANKTISPKGCIRVRVAGEHGTWIVKAYDASTAYLGILVADALDAERQIWVAKLDCRGINSAHGRRFNSFYHAAIAAATGER